MKKDCPDCIRFAHAKGVLIIITMLTCSFGFGMLPSIGVGNIVLTILSIAMAYAAGTFTIIEAEENKKRKEKSCSKKP